MRVETCSVRIPPDVTLRVETYPGNGATLVMLPGAGFGAAALGGLPLRLATAGYRVLAVNPRGAAGSSGPVDGVTLHDLAADVAGIIEGLGGGPAHVLGHAGGNRVARCLAVDRPDLVRTLVLLAAGGLVPPEADVAQALRNSMGGSASVAERQTLRRAMLAPTSDPRLADAFVSWEATRRAFRSAVATPLEEWWHGGDAPMLVIQGLEDRIAPPGNGRALAADHPDRVRLIELPNAGHGLPVEQPEAIARAIVSWLADYPSDARMRATSSDSLNS